MAIINLQALNVQSVPTEWTTHILIIYGIVTIIRWVLISRNLHLFELIYSLIQRVIDGLLNKISLIETYSSCFYFGTGFHVLHFSYEFTTPNGWSLSMESIYATIHSIVTNQINVNKGQMLFPLISALFIYILINNLVGMVPYSFAPTSHFLKLLFLLVPFTYPLGLLPLLVLI